MISFKQYFLEKAESEEEIRSRMKLTKEYTLMHRGKWIIDTFHKLAQEFKRGKFPKQEKLFKDAIDWILDKKKGIGVFLFVSKSSKLGMIVDHRKDGKNRVKGKNLIIVTWFGKIEKDIKDVFTKKKSDTKVILEYNKTLHIKIDEIIKLN